MSLINFPSIIKPLPALTSNNKRDRLEAGPALSDDFDLKRTALLNYPKLFVLTLSAVLLLSACDNEGIVGSKFIEGGNNLTASVIEPDAVTPVTVNGYTGKLRHLAVGQYNDPLFGGIHSVGLIKPAIVSSTISTIDEDETLKLRLVFSSDVYGDTTSNADFDIFRVSEYWRGSELRYGDDISWDHQALVGSFTASGIDTVVVDLDPGWVSDFNEFLESDDENKSAIYRDTFFGLAIVPSSGDSKIEFPKILPAIGEDESNTELVRFIVVNENEEEEVKYLPVLDWGSIITRTPTSGQETSTYHLHNMLESFLEVEPGLTEEKIGSKNVANVDFVFYQDQETLESSLPEGHVRPETERARIHFVTPEHQPGDYIFNNSPSLIAQRDPDDNSFRFDLTGLANSILYGSTPAGGYYLSIESINGLIYSTMFYSDSAPEQFRPKIIISTINKPDY